MWSLKNANSIQFSSGMGPLLYVIAKGNARENGETILAIWVGRGLVRALRCVLGSVGG